MPPAQPRDYPLIPRGPLGRWTVCTVFGLCLLGVVSAIIYVSIPTGSAVYDGQGTLKQARFLREGVYESLPALPIACSVLLLMAATILLVRRRKRQGVACVCASILLFVMLWAIGPVRLRADWTIMGRIAATGGPEYFLIAQPAQPSQIAVGRLTSTGKVYQTVDLLAPPVPMSQIPLMLLIRPTPLKSTNPGRLYLTSSGLLVWVEFENVCHIVYDVRSRRFYNEDEISHISPFILVDEESSIYAPDEATILSELNSAKNYHRGLPPTAETLKQALNHPNPAVRESVAHILSGAKPATSP